MSKKRAKGRNRCAAHFIFFSLYLLWGLPFAVSAESQEKTGTSQWAAPGSPSGQAQRAVRALAVETFLADIAQNVAGNRLRVESLLPVGVDPHGFEPTPKDVKKVAESTLLIINGAGFEGFLEELLREAGGKGKIIEASAGLKGRTPRETEETGGRDPHFWLDPTLVIKYAENIRGGMSGVDPDGSPLYSAGAASYIAKLGELDRWIREQVRQVPEQKRTLVTNHESLGYFADRYGFRIVGTIIPSVSTFASPSARELAALVETVRKSGVRAIFLETGANPKLAQQLAGETGIKVVKELYTHSVSDPKGEAPTYVDMMRFNTRVIVDALK